MVFLLYIKKNSLYTKHEVERKFGAPLLINNILNMETDDPMYGPKRRVVSSAFFKGRVQKMVRLVKETALE